MLRNGNVEPKLRQEAAMISRTFIIRSQTKTSYFPCQKLSFIAGFTGGTTQDT